MYQSTCSTVIIFFIYRHERLLSITVTFISFDTVRLIVVHRLSLLYVINVARVFITCAIKMHRHRHIESGIYQWHSFLYRVNSRQFYKYFQRIQKKYISVPTIILSAASVNHLNIHLYRFFYLTRVFNNNSSVNFFIFIVSKVFTSEQ